MLRSILVLVVIATTACSRPTTETAYDPETGRLQKLVFDYTKNGTNETTAVMDGTRIVRVELDLDENGRVERWDFYGTDRRIQKVGLSSFNDGVMDSQAYYAPDGRLARIDVSSQRDGVFDRTEFYEHGTLLRSHDDTNRDGRPDKWDTYEPRRDVPAGEPAFAITSTAFDDTGSGRPERRFVYGAGGAIVRVEVDPDGDGTWDPMTAAVPAAAPASPAPAVARR
jgi:hypothetical protein